MPERFPYLSITVVLLTTGETLLPHKDVQKVSITYHTPQQLHRLKVDDWNQLREARFPVDRVWEQGMSLDTPGEEDLTFSSSLMNV